MDQLRSNADRMTEARIGHRSLRLPGGLLAAAYVALCLVPVLLTTTRDVTPLTPWGLAAAALGLAGLTAMAIQFVTSGRFQVVSGRLGIDRIMAFHKVAARWVLLGLLLHPVLYVLPTWLEDRALGMELLLAYLTVPHYRTGVIALAALVLLVFTSLLRDRLPWRYEVWRASHVLLAVTAVAAGLHHAVSAGRFSAAGPVLGFWWLAGLGLLSVMAVLYGWRWFLLHRRPWRLASVTRVADRMWELDVRPASANTGWPYKAGQFVWMSEGRRRFPLFDHPFSIADSPRREGIGLIIKEAGDFTSRIGTLQPGTPIGLDGPYGDFVLESHPAENVLLLAGGVGIAPIMGLLRDMVVRGDPRPVRLAYAAGHPANFACLSEIEAAKTTLDLRAVYLSEEGAEDWRDDIGRLDRDRLADLMDGLDPKRTVALICGPGPMVTAVSDALLDLGMPMRNVVYERFDYGGGLTSRQDRSHSLQIAAVGLALALALAIAGVVLALR